MHRRTNLVGLVVLVAISTGCSASGTYPTAESASAGWTLEREQTARRLAARLASEPANDGGGVSVRLAFLPSADLDLYVTGPTLETVYHGNPRARSGGQLRADRHCKDAGSGTRVEHIDYPAPAAGTFRVGVDYAHRCNANVEAVPFAILVDAPAGRTTEIGLAVPHVFQPIVLEIDVAP